MFVIWKLLAIAALNLQHCEPFAMNVYLTVDTEVWPEYPDWREKDLADDVLRDLYGRTSAGDYGAFYQAEMLAQHGLRGVFFVESLYTYAAGQDSLRTTVERLQALGHEVGLHTHTEWLKRVELLEPGRRADSMHQLSATEQQKLIALGINRLREAGVQNVRSYRAGGFGANFDTLQALAANGIFVDSSHNACFFGSTCRLETEKLLVQPRCIDGVYEFPVSVFVDRPNHLRPAELCAASSGELETALWNALREGWRSFVIVSHSFELVKRGPWGHRTGPFVPDGVVLRRFQRLCSFLAQHRDKFETSTFAEDASYSETAYRAPVRGRYHQTAWRVMEQLMRRVA